MHGYNICPTTTMNQETFRRREKGGRKWGRKVGSLSVTHTGRISV